jgi:arsenite methyltransferase
MMEPENTHGRMESRYASLAKGDPPCERERRILEPVEQAKSLGYSEAALSLVPSGAIMGMGCGNPTALAELRTGETVLDAGCGGGLDVFLAANAVGETGRVLGVDSTPRMVERARENARGSGYGNVRFEQGEVEHLPVEDGCIDVVISNCVLNHCLDKLVAFREILRVLKHGGRMHIADLVTTDEFPKEAYNDAIWGAWLTVASGRQEYLDTIQKAGFREIRVDSQGSFAMAEANPQLAGKIENIRVSARK